jgi:hypothetical protein
VVGAATLASCLVAAEAVLRLGEPYDAARMERELEDLVAEMLPGRTQGQQREETVKADAQPPALHPYFGYDWVEHNADLARDLAYFQGEESQTNYDVLLVGGSVAASFGGNGAPTLRQRLEADARFQDRPVRVLSYGRGGYKQPQQVFLLAYLLALGFRPDAVLAIDGFNECALANANLTARVHPAHPSAGHWAHLAWDKPSDRAALDLLVTLRGRQREAETWLALARQHGLTRSALLGELLAARLRVLRRRYMAAGARYGAHMAAAPSPAVTGPPLPDDAEAARAQIVGVWFEGSRSLDGLCRARGIRFVHVLQPTLHDEGSKPITQEEREAGTIAPDWLEGVRYGYPLLRARGAELRELGIEFADGSQVFRAVPETLYYDACHFDRRGNELLANFVADAFLAGESATPGAR